MSKERLKIAVDIKNYIDSQGEYDKEVEVMDWLIKEVKRAQELSDIYWRQNERINSLNQQNKYYREIFKKIVSVKNDENFNPYAYMMLEIIEWANEALESDQQ